MRRMWRMWRMRRMRLKISGGPVRYFQLIIQAKRAECETNSGARRLRTKSAKSRSGNPDFKRRGNFFFAALKAARNGKKRNPRGVSHQARRKPIPPRGMRNSERGRRNPERGAQSPKLSVANPARVPPAQNGSARRQSAPAVNPKRLSYAKNDTRQKILNGVQKLK